MGIDLKAPMEDYPSVTGVDRNLFDNTRESIRILEEKGVFYEARTTIYPYLAEPSKLGKLVDTYTNVSTKAPVFQIWRREGQERCQGGADGAVLSDQKPGSTGRSSYDKFLFSQSKAGASGWESIFPVGFSEEISSFSM
ncbi:MAG: hypothetical protein MZW92_71850 [Comamonadaceae bacterium]|nr:hypothetical protein [Comamonadaceae bacterium]